MKVLAVGTTTASAQPAPAANGTTASTQAPQQQQGSGLITVEATPRQAEQIAHAMSYGGTITISLNPPNFNAQNFKTPAEVVESMNLFDQPLTYLNSVQGQLDALKK
jgi:hypothetical protein